MRSSRRRTASPSASWSVVRRRDEIARLENELEDKRRALRSRLAELERVSTVAAD